MYPTVRLARIPRRGSQGTRSCLHLEQLEMRNMPSVLTPQHIVFHSLAGGAGADGSAGPVGLKPDQIRHAYGIDLISFSAGSVRGDGSGQTIAIIDAFDNPRFV